MKPKENLAAPIPFDLADEDELLHRFGRWAMLRKGPKRCGSAEGQYRAPANDDDRVAREILLPPMDAMRVQKALSRVPHKWRVILEVLYVPRRGGNGKVIPCELWLRIMRIPPKLCQERHLEGLRQFSNIYRTMIPKSQIMGMMRPPVAATETPACLLAGPGVGEALAMELES
jgi:hypothetical protein